MALSKIVRDSLNTGIDDNSDATAITIDSSENVGIGTASPSQPLSILTSNGLLNIANGNTSNGTKIQSFVTAGNANGYLAFEGFDKEYVRLDADGLKFNGDTAAANALDDYEYGVFDPDLTCSGTNYSSRTIGSRGGYYEKVGNAVFTYIYLDLSAFTLGSGSGNMKISGLPFSASTARAGSGGGGGVAFHGVNVGSTVYNVMPYASGSEVIFLTSRDQASWTAVQIGDIHSGTIFGVWFQLNYYVD